MEISRRDALRFGGTAALAVALAACSSGTTATTANVDVSNAADLLAAAQKEGQLLWYTALSTAASNAVAAAFRAQYPGISVNIIRDTSADIWARFQTENAAHKNQADVVNFADFGITTTAEKAKLLAKYEPQSVTQALSQGLLAKNYVDANGYFFSCRALVMNIAYSTKTVPADVAPKTWTDLTNPWWGKQGKLGLIDPATTAVVNAYYAMDKAGLAQPLFSGIAPFKPLIYNQAGAIQNALSSGEIDGAIITDYSAWSLIASGGSSLAAVYPAEGVGAWTDYETVAAAAPHPYAARLFSDFLGGKAGSEADAKTEAIYMVRKDVPPYPAQRPPFSSLNVLPLNLAEVEADKAAFLKKFNQWIGR